MKRTRSIIVAVILLAAWALSGEAHAMIRGRTVRNQSTIYQWHGGYYEAVWGMPLAVVVTPRAKTNTNYGWGVGGTTVTPIQSQFRPGYPGPGEYRREGFQPTPAWPSNTDQFGDYYVRGPR